MPISDRPAAPVEKVLPTPEESWQRNMEILELVTEIREARRRRIEEAHAQATAERTRR